jgi:hypothetical protein
MTPASTLAGDEISASSRRERIEIRTDSTRCAGDQRSAAVSPDSSSSPGECRMEMQSFPSE